MGEFAWVKFEPADGVFDFAWFDEVLARLGEQDIYSIVCTPSAAPPIWLVEAHPEIAYVDNRGMERPFGGRRHYCYTHPVYREYVRRIAVEMGQRYGKLPHVLGFHIDNELAQEATGRCHCPVCKTQFQQWLAGRYGDIAHFNARAGTIFWGQTYTDFAQIPLPICTIETCGEEAIEHFRENPTIRLDFERFCSDALIDFQNIQADALRQGTTLPVTTNATGYWTNGINYYQSFSTLDVVACDIYPAVRADDMLGASLDFAFHRGIKRQNFWMVETTCSGGQGVWDKQGMLQPYPGELRQNALHAYASGADVITYFQFRSFRFGAEQLETGALSIDGIPDRRFAEFQQVAADLQKLTPLLDNTVLKNRVAICFDYDSFWAIKIKPFAQSYAYQQQIADCYAAFRSAGIGVDIIPCTAAIYDYPLLILPTPVIMTEGEKVLLKYYVQQGGTLITNFLAATKGADNTAPRAPIPAGLTELFGMRVREGEPVFTDGQNTTAHIAVTLDGETATGENAYWTESLELLGAEALGVYADTFRQGEPVISRHRYGAGAASYLGTWLAPAPLQRLLLHLAHTAGIQCLPFAVPTNMEVVTRWQDETPVYFVFNFQQSPSEVTLDKKYTDLLTGHTLSGKVPMGAKAFLVLK